MSNAAIYTYDQPTVTISGDVGFSTTTVQAPNGVITTTGRDLDGNAVTSEVGTLTPTQTMFDPAGNILSSTDPNGVTTSHTYDGWGESLTTTSPSGSGGVQGIANYNYDAAGHMVSKSDELSHVTSYGYDGDGNITSVTEPGASTPWKITYDGAGQRVEVVDPTGIKRDWQYNTLGEVAASFEYPTTAGNQTGYSYDANGELTETDLPTGVALCFTYDDYGNQASRYQVASAGTCSTGAKQTLEFFTFNPLNGLTNANEGSSGPSIAVNYDPADPEHVSSVVEGANQTTYAYSGQTGVLSSTTDVVGSVSNRTSYTYKSVSGLLATATDPFSHQATTYDYNDGGQITDRIDAAGVTTAYGYDQDGRLHTQLSTGGSGTLSYTILYDKANRITSLAQTLPTASGTPNPGSGTWTYLYTSADELQSSQFGSGPTTTYTYDNADNRKTVQVGTNSAVTWTYDNAGRLTSDGSKSYTWNSLDELTDAATTHYSYDPWGRLSAAVVGSQTINYGADALSRTLTRAVQGGASTTFTYTGMSQNPSSSRSEVGIRPTTYGQAVDFLPRARVPQVSSRRPTPTATSPCSRTPPAPSPGPSPTTHSATVTAPTPAPLVRTPPPANSATNPSQPIRQPGWWIWEPVFTTPPKVALPAKTASSATSRTLNL